MTKTWITLQVTTLTLTLLHIFIDLHIGLWGPSSEELSFSKFLLLLSIVIAIGWWVYLLTDTSKQSHQQGLFVMSIILGFVANGLGGLVGCFPPCQAAFPWQDLNHIAVFIIGAICSYSTFNIIKSNSEEDPKSLQIMIISGVIIIIHFIFQLFLLEF